MPLSDVIDRIYVINLPFRADRRREMTVELERAGLRLGPGEAEFFPAVRPTEPGPFPSIGTRGAYTSHLNVLKRARDEGLANVMVMEDDLSISPAFRDVLPAVVEQLSSREWDMAYFGHVLDLEATPGFSFLPYSEPVLTAHWYAVSAPTIGRLIDFLELLLTREPGHPDGSPMDVDGAISTFRHQNPDVRTVVASPNLGTQRSSRSDIRPNWYDRVPVLRQLYSLGRSLKFRLKSRPGSQGDEPAED